MVRWHLLTVCLACCLSPRTLHARALWAHHNALFSLDLSKCRAYAFSCIVGVQAQHQLSQGTLALLLYMYP